MDQRGFTLMEMMTVVLIIGILAAVALPGYMRSVERARATEAMEAIKALNEAIYVYYVEKESCPSYSKLVVSLPAQQTNNFEFTLDAQDRVPGTTCSGVKATRTGGGYSYYIWNPYRKTGGRALALQCSGSSEKDLDLCDSLGYGPAGS